MTLKQKTNEVKGLKMLQELEDSCIVDGLDHAYEFAFAENGSSYYKCRLCPATVTEIEDSQP